MTLINLSDASLSKIYDCLTSKIYDCLISNTQSISRFARTNYRHFKTAELQGRFKEVVSTVSVNYEKETGISTANFLCLSALPKVEEAKNPNVRMLLMKQLEKFSSMMIFSLQNFEVTEELLSLLREVLLRFTTSSKFLSFTFEKCEFQCTDSQLLETIKYLNIKRLTMRNANFNNTKITNMFLSSVPSTFLIHSKNILKYNVDDQMLTNWLYRMPYIMELKDINTEITLNGVLTFVKKLSDKVVAKSVTVPWQRISLGEVKTNDNYENSLTIALRNPAIDWKVNNIESEPHVKHYTATIGKLGHIMFEISTVNYNRITRQQVSNKIADLRTQITENIEMDHFYEVENDEYMMQEINQLLGAIYPEWTDLHTLIKELQSMGAEFEDEESDEEEEKDNN